MLLIRILVEEVKQRVHNTEATYISSLFLFKNMIIHFDREFLSELQISTTFLYIMRIRPT
jgi:hypothetical protein